MHIECCSQRFSLSSTALAWIRVSSSVMRVYRCYAPGSIQQCAHQNPLTYDVPLRDSAR